jgi:hypothetical protein
MCLSLVGAQKSAVKIAKRYMHKNPACALNGRGRGFLFGGSVVFFVFKLF